MKERRSGRDRVDTCRRHASTHVENSELCCAKGGNAFNFISVENPKVIGELRMCADAASMQEDADFKTHKPTPTRTVMESLT
jgi:hypothetical protein